MDVDNEQDREASATPTNRTPRAGSPRFDWDMSERERLDALHTMHISLLNPRHDHLVTAHLARVHANGRRSQVLDVGTGTGTWAISMARSQPYSDVLGVDIKWSHFAQPENVPHGNVAFATVDVSQQLPWPDNTFDLIHVKAMLMDIPYYPKLVQRLAHTLRPGGLLILVESDLSYESVRGPVADAVRTWSESLGRALAPKNTDVTLPRQLDTAIAATGMFSPQFYFQEIGCPVGPYMKGESKALLRAGQIQAAVIRASLRRLVLNRLEPGPERVRLEHLIDACTKELCSANSRYLQRLYAVYAYKKTGWR